MVQRRDVNQKIDPFDYKNGLDFHNLHKKLSQKRDFVFALESATKIDTPTKSGESRRKVDDSPARG